MQSQGQFGQDFKYEVPRKADYMGFSVYPDGYPDPTPEKPRQRPVPDWVSEAMLPTETREQLGLVTAGGSKGKDGGGGGGAEQVLIEKNSSAAQHISMANNKGVPSAPAVENNPPAPLRKQQQQQQSASKTPNSLQFQTPTTFKSANSLQLRNNHHQSAPARLPPSAFAGPVLGNASRAPSPLMGQQEQGMKFFGGGGGQQGTNATSYGFNFNPSNPFTNTNSFTNFYSNPNNYAGYKNTNNLQDDDTDSIMEDIADFVNNEKMAGNNGTVKEKPVKKAGGAMKQNTTAGVVNPKQTGNAGNKDNRGNPRTGNALGGDTNKKKNTNANASVQKPGGATNSDAFTKANHGGAGRNTSGGIKNTETVGKKTSTFNPLPGFSNAVVSNPGVNISNATVRKQRVTTKKTGLVNPNAGSKNILLINPKNTGSVNPDAGGFKNRIFPTLSNALVNMSNAMVEKPGDLTKNTGPVKPNAGFMNNIFPTLSNAGVNMSNATVRKPGGTIKNTGPVNPNAGNPNNAVPGGTTKNTGPVNTNAGSRNTVVLGNSTPAKRPVSSQGSGNGGDTKRRRTRKFPQVNSVAELKAWLAGGEGDLKDKLEHYIQSDVLEGILKREKEGKGK